MLSPARPVAKEGPPDGPTIIPKMDNAVSACTVWYSTHGVAAVPTDGDRRGGDPWCVLEVVRGRRQNLKMHTKPKSKNSDIFKHFFSCLFLLKSTASIIKWLLLVDVDIFENGWILTPSYFYTFDTEIQYANVGVQQSSIRKSRDYSILRPSLIWRRRPHEEGRSCSVSDIQAGCTSSRRDHSRRSMIDAVAAGKKAT